MIFWNVVLSFNNAIKNATCTDFILINKQDLFKFLEAGLSDHHQILSSKIKSSSFQVPPLKTACRSYKTGCRNRNSVLTKFSFLFSYCIYLFIYFLWRVNGIYHRWSAFKLLTTFHFTLLDIQLLKNETY